MANYKKYDCILLADHHDGKTSYPKGSIIKLTREQMVSSLFKGKIQVNIIDDESVEETTEN